MSGFSVQPQRRWPGSGKSGGDRIVTFRAGRDVPVFRLDACTKGERANLPRVERSALAAILPRPADAYRRSKAWVSRVGA